jgi:hypothetical protein
VLSVERKLFIIGERNKEETKIPTHRYKVVARIEHDGRPVGRPFNAGTVQASTPQIAQRRAQTKVQEYNQKSFKQGSGYEAKTFRVNPPKTLRK